MSDEADLEKNKVHARSSGNKVERMLLELFRKYLAHDYGCQSLCNTCGRSTKGMKQCFQNPKPFSALVNYCGFACLLFSQTSYFINILFLSCKSF